jgi:hypothetical protein
MCREKSAFEVICTGIYYKSDPVVRKLIKALVLFVFQDIHLYKVAIQY